MKLATLTLFTFILHTTTHLWETDSIEMKQLVCDIRRKSNFSRQNNFDICNLPTNLKNFMHGLLLYSTISKVDKTLSKHSLSPRNTLKSKSTQTLKKSFFPTSFNFNQSTHRE